MARNRMIQSDDFTCEAYANCSREARYLFDRMACFCDDRGVHPDSAKSLKMAVFPGDEDLTSADVQRMLDDLLANGLLQQFEADGRSWLHVVEWSKRQRVDRPTYRFPEPPAREQSGEPSPKPPLPVDTPSPKTRRVLDEESPSPRPELKGIEEKLNTPLPPKGECEASEFVKAWNAIPGVLRVSKLTEKRQRSLKARLAESHFREHWRTGLQIVGRSEFCRGLQARTDGRSDRPWQADFDWFLKPDSLVRLLEGKYGGLPNGSAGGAANAPPALRPERKVPRLTLEDLADTAAFDRWFQGQEAFERDDQTRQDLHALRLTVVEIFPGEVALGQLAARLRNRLEGRTDPMPPRVELRHQAARELASLKAARPAEPQPAAPLPALIGGAA